MSPFADRDNGPQSVGFAAALYAQRRAAGLTQEELAARAGLGVRTVRELERGRVGRPQRGTVNLLADALALTGPARQAFVSAAMASRGVESATGALPPAMELIGRSTDLAELDALLGTVGVITLVGLAGVGKTCLAVAAAHGCTHRFMGGVAMLPVSDVSARDDLVAGTASAFGVARAADLPDRFGGEPALLLVDGIDRSPRACAAAVRWLRSHVPALRILATGRHPLDVPGSVDWRVEALDVPPHGDDVADLAALSTYPAVRLFLGRLRQVRRAPVVEAEAAALAELVRRLGGLPLALELAAARGRVLELPELLARYGDRLLDLGAAEPDGQTLRDAVAASYRLLDRDEQYALRRLSVLRGRWSVDLAEAMLGDRPELDVETTLDRLMGLGLVSVRGSGELRFRLLDVVGDFALERCREVGELGTARLRHAEIFTALAARVAGDLVGPGQSAAIERLDQLNSDVRAALGYASQRVPHTALELAAAIARWCRFRSRDREARTLLRRLLDDPRTADADPLLRARAQVAAAMLAAAHGEGAVELPATEDALSAFIARGDVGGELAARNILFTLWQSIGEYREAIKHGEATLALATRTERIRDIAVVQNNLSWHDVRAGDLASATRRLSVAARRAVEVGDERVRAVALCNLAEIARLDRRYPEAIDAGRRALTVLADLGDPSHRIRALGTVGLALAESGQVTEARLVIDELRVFADSPVADGLIDLIKGYLALGAGDRTGAGAAFTDAGDRLAGRHDARDVLEALVGKAAALRCPTVRAEIDAFCDRIGLALLPRDHALLEA
jgi:predicted ATPase